MPKLKPNKPPKIDKQGYQLIERNEVSYAFWFSSNIEDWIRSRKTKYRHLYQKARS